MERPSPPPPQPQLSLPPLRRDLRLLPGPMEVGGEPTWLIHDPLKGRYYKIGYPQFQMLSRWSAPSIDALIAEISNETVLTLTKQDVLELIVFLRKEMLVERSGAEDIQALLQVKAAKAKLRLFSRLPQLLFLRIPLVRPDRFLERMMPLADLFSSAVFKAIIGVLGLLGIVLILRQWEEFQSTFIGYLNWQGAIWFAITLTLVKFLHEFGHAFSAKKYGCHVPTMGIALLLFYPVLFTDTSDSWRLTERRKRLNVGAAGIRVELALALIAGLMWSFVPDGPLRSAVFMVASFTWLSTLFVNLNPLMRFDGYYLLSDLVGIPNLQNRSFEFGKWSIRRYIFGMSLPLPEPASRRMRWGMITYCYATWIYRLLLFTGIAIAVYLMFFKALGLALLVVEIVMLIIVPIVREIGVMWKMRHLMRWNRGSMTSAGLVIAMLFLLFWPWQTSIKVQAIVSSPLSTQITNALPGQVRQVLVAPGDRVEKGDLLYELALPELEQSTTLLTEKRNIAMISYDQALVSQQARANLSELQADIARQTADLNRIATQSQRLKIYAPQDGTVRDLNPSIKPGVWLQSRQVLARLVSDDPFMATAYVDNTKIGPCEPGAAVTFIPDTFELASLPGHLTKLDQIGRVEISEPYFVAQYGGDFAASENDKGSFTMRSPVFRLEADLSFPEGYPTDHTLSGVLKIETPPKSIFASVWQKATVILLRESTF